MPTASLPGFLQRFNARFAVEAEEPGLAYRPLDPSLDLDRILSFRYQRVVARDNTVRLDGRLIQISPGPRRRSYFAARVWVHEFLDGSLGAWYQDQWLVRGKGNELAKVRARKRRPPLPERAPLVELPQSEAQAAHAVLSSPSPAPHPWRRWNPGYWNASGQPRVEVKRTHELRALCNIPNAPSCTCLIRDLAVEQRTESTGEEVGEKPVGDNRESCRSRIGTKGCMNIFNGRPEESPQTDISRFS